MEERARAHAPRILLLLPLTLLCGGALLAQDRTDPVVSLRYRAVPLLVDTDRLVQGNHRLAILELPPTCDLEILRRSGLQALRPLGDGAWIGRVKDPELWPLLAQRAMGPVLLAPYEPVDRLHPLVREALAAGRAPAYVATGQPGVLPLSVSMLQAEDAGALRRQLARLGCEIPEPRARHGGRLLVLAPLAQVRPLAGLPEVLSVELADLPRHLHNLQAQQIHHVDTIQASPYFLDGAGVRVGLWDGGPTYGHADFGGRTTVIEPGWTDDHATHVMGTILGSGLGNPAAEGMAPAAQGYSYDFNGDVATEMSSAVSSHGIVASNNSWGLNVGWYHDGWGWSMGAPASLFGDYTASESADIDQLVASQDQLVVVWACGNDRGEGPPGQEDGTLAPDGEFYDCIDPYGVAKNILSVGALSDSPATMTSFSSFGPADDGRVKPDLVANGESVTSTTPYGYDSWDGTSMAAPVVTGTVTSLTGAYLSGAGGGNPPAALLKAVLLGTCDDLHLPGPDARTGFGRLNARRAADLLAAHFSPGVEHLVTGSVSTGQVFTRSFSVPGGTPLRATLCWTDPPGSGAAASALVNDLDLELVAPGGGTHLPFRLAAASPHLAATRGVNRVDNVEQVVVSSPIAGTWTLRVIGYSVSGSQAFALASSASLSGGSPPPPATYPLSGRVALVTGAGVAGVAVNLTGASVASTTTDGSGGYAFQVSSGTCTVTPVSGSYTFSPPSRSVVLSGAAVTGQDFTATPTGGGSPPGTCQYLQDEVPDLAIPDDDPWGVVSQLQVPASFSITDLLVRVEVRHTYRGDLRLELVAPGGWPTALLKEVDGWDSAPDVRGTYDLTLTPVDPLDRFNGLDAQGTWELRVSDNLAWDTGVLEEWELILDGCPGVLPPAALTITTTGLPPGTQGQPYAASLAATGGTPPYSWILIGGNLPAGLSLSTGGTISGTPTGTGTSSFTVLATDAAAGSDSAALTLEIQPGVSPVVITTTSLPAATQGAPYSVTLAASGGTPPYSWILTGGSLPSGLTLSSSGTIGGAPTQIGTFFLSVLAADAAGGSATRPLTLYVQPATPGSTTGICGDCSNDGAVDITDAMLAAQVGVLLAAVPPGAEGQCNVQGGPASAIDVVDALSIARFLVGLVPTLTCVP